MSNDPFMSGGPAVELTPRPQGPQRLAIQFTGSGSEYFRIWMVNLLLTLVTLTLYHPFAKARKLAYFHSNTLVDGHALGFHGDPRKMLRGYLLVLGFSATYAVTSRLAPVWALVAIVGFVLVWPALWRASLQFRLGNTSWRGLRMRFDGGVGGAYRAMLPAALPWVAMVVLSVFVPPMPQPSDEAGPGNGTWALGFGLVMLMALVLLPLSLAWIKRYQHSHYHYAGQHSRLDASIGAFYGLSFKVVGLMILVSLAAAALLGAGAVLLFSGMEKGAAARWTTVWMVAGMLLTYALMFVIPLPYGRSRLQNLVWGRTRSDALQFHSELRLWPLVGLTLKNLLLTVFTLGLYWPFAAVASARMRLQAVTIDVDGDVSHWIAASGSRAGGATGDAAGDFFGIDVGL